MISLSDYRTVYIHSGGFCPRCGGNILPSCERITKPFNVFGRDIDVLTKFGLEDSCLQCGYVPPSNGHRRPSAEELKRDNQAEASFKLRLGKRSR